MGKKCVKKPISNHPHDILSLLETKIQDVEERDVRAVWGGGNMGRVAKDSMGGSGWLWIVWNSNNWKMIRLEIKDFSISVVREELATCKRFLLSNAYSPYDDAARNDFWEE